MNECQIGPHGKKSEEASQQKQMIIKLVASPSRLLARLFIPLAAAALLHISVSNSLERQDDSWAHASSQISQKKKKFSFPYFSGDRAERS